MALFRQHIIADLSAIGSPAAPSAFARLGPLAILGVAGKMIRVGMADPVRGVLTLFA